ncbi:LanC-like protein 2 [Borealophlyctis nickersoniae]|nr:LanC-like protein 2 [Borealophlyctis nickersoniae]
MLMSIPDIVNGKEGTAVKGTVDWMADQILRDNGNWPSSLDSSSRPDRLVQWCHGPPGAILCLCRAYDVYKDHTYLDAAKRAAEVVWEKGLLTKGVGLCHGIRLLSPPRSGNAYSFLHLYALTRDQKYWDRTIRFALFATEWESRTQNGELGVPEHPWSLFEGLAGAVMLWRDVLRLAGAEELDGFPCFMDE